jgi:hypothetical protein
MGSGKLGANFLRLRKTWLIFGALRIEFQAGASLAFCSNF